MKNMTKLRSALSFVVKQTEFSPFPNETVEAGRTLGQRFVTEAHWARGFNPSKSKILIKIIFLILLVI